MIDEIIEKLLNYENHQTQHLAYIYLKEIISKWMVEDDALPYLTLLFDILFKELQQKDSKNTPHHYIHIYQLLTQIIIYLTKYQPNRLYYLDDIIPLLLNQWHQSIKYFLNKQYQRQPQRTSKYILFISSFKNKNMDRCDDNYNKRKEALLALMTCLCTIVESAPMKSKSCIDFLFQSILKMTACQMKSIHHDRHSFAMTTKKNNYKNQCYFPVDQQHHQHQRSHMLTFRIQLVEQSLYFMNIIIQTLGSIKGRSLIQSSKYELIDLFSILISSTWSIDLKCITYHLLGKCYILSTDFMKRTIDLFLPTILSNFDIIVYHNHNHCLYTNDLNKLIYIFSTIINKKAQLLHQYKSDIIKKLITLILDNSMQYQLRIVISSIITQLIQQDTITLQPYLLSEAIETFLYLLNQIPIMIENSKEAYFIYKQLIRSLLILMDTFFIIDILPLLYKAIQNFPSHDHFSLSCSFYESLSLFKMDIGTQRWQELLINMPPSTLLALEEIQSLSPFCIQL